MVWDEFGVWKGRVEQENGEWLIGDQLPLDHPGHVAANDPRGLMVKYWKSSPHDPSGKYCGSGHTPSLPAHDGRVEGVQVLRGWFYCGCKDSTIELRDRTSVVPSRNTIELAPDEPRRWFLGSSPQAWGVTVCRRMTCLPWHFGAGAGYYYEVLDSAIMQPQAWTRRLDEATRRGLGNCWLIMVFRGLLTRTVARETTHALVSYTNDYAYVRAAAGGQWQPEVFGRTVAAVVYY